jgi:hypothetical protein
MLRNAVARTVNCRYELKFDAAQVVLGALASPTWHPPLGFDHDAQHGQHDLWQPPLQPDARAQAFATHVLACRETACSALGGSIYLRLSHSPPSGWENFKTALWPAWLLEDNFRPQHQCSSLALMWMRSSWRQLRWT